MQPSNSRAVELRELMKEDAVGLRNCRIPDGTYQPKFELLCSATELKKSDVEACLNLIEETSGADYKASSAGWNPVRKKAEMIDKDMIYLLVRRGDENVLSTTKGEDAERMGEISSQTHSEMVKGHETESQPHGPTESVQSQGTPGLRTTNSPNSGPKNDEDILGFISFMFTYDDPPNQDREVVYIYEIHLHTRLRGYGLGSRLIKLVEKVAHVCGISKTMLTVFTANKGARLLYERLGYTKDECSPKDRVMRRKTIEADYQIMSKESPCNI